MIARSVSVPSGTSSTARAAPGSGLRPVNSSPVADRHRPSRHRAGRRVRSSEDLIGRPAHDAPTSSHDRADCIIAHCKYPGKLGVSNAVTSLAGGQPTIDDVATIFSVKPADQSRLPLVELLEGMSRVEVTDRPQERWRKKLPETIHRRSRKNRIPRARRLVVGRRRTPPRLHFGCQSAPVYCHTGMRWRS